ncbi:hypothetical protein AURDEDRAFT_43611, partial [Auricularia subglabra TFB-10046 SS5]
FPFPLVLPDDDLAFDPDYPAQSVSDWTEEPDRNKVLRGRDVLYVAAPPNVAPDAQFIKKWTSCSDSDTLPSKSRTVTGDVVDYLTAFYHGMPVRHFTGSLTFTSWSSSNNSKASSSTAPRYIGLDTSTERIRIRTRACPDGHYARQLNSDDLLDAIASILPADAYAIILLVDHDMWESKEDDFLCGRAYGASRIAVVSSARYNPALDTLQCVERVHAWPASHCAAYVHAQCSGGVRSKKRKGAGAADTANGTATSPMRAALTAFASYKGIQPEPGLWLSRICRTASHELGHCLGLDHCVYYACAMQGTASVAEDARQPPYLCPVDLTKLLRATGGDATERYRALLAYSRKHAAESSLFAAYAAW